MLTISMRFLTITMIVFSLLIFESVDISAADNGDSVADYLESQNQRQEQDPEQNRNNTGTGIEKEEPSSSPVWMFMKLVLSLAFILFLIYVFYKLLVKRKGFVNQKGELGNIGGVALGNQRSVQLVRVGDEVLVVGVGENVTLLRTLDAESAKDLVKDQDSRLPANAIFDKFTNRKNQQTSPPRKPTPFADELKRLVRERTDQLKETKRKGQDDG